MWISDYGQRNKEELQNICMVSMNSSLDEVKNLVRDSIGKLYTKDKEAFKRNKQRGVSERSIVFRFAHYLQNTIDDDNENIFVDCDWNSSFVDDRGKPISGTKRFIDIIVHKRDSNQNHNLICFEIKKWNNYNSKEFAKDKKNLEVLTDNNYQYQYNYGFHITIHRDRRKSKWTIYENGNPITSERERTIFENEPVSNS